MNFREVLLILFLFGTLTWCNAQSEMAMDTVQLQSITIASTSIRNQQVGTVAKNWNKPALSKLNMRNLAGLLEQSAGVYVKHYGTGTLSTVSVRGASSSQTAILWNGMPLTSPTLGLMDVSLVPLEGFESISFQKGGHAALWGSGAVGGNIQLHTKLESPVLSDSLRFGVNGFINFDRGSFQSNNLAVGAHYGGKKIYGRTQYLFALAKNNFPYRRDETLKKEWMQNAEQISHQLFQDITWDIDADNRIDFNYWTTAADRNIPPTIFQNRSLANQVDVSNRAMISWSHSNIFFNGKLKYGIIDEDNNYRDELAKIHSKNNFRSQFLEAVVEKKGKFGQLLLGYSLFRTSAKTASYSLESSENKSALFTSYRKRWKQFNFQGSLRSEVLNGTFIPLVPNIGVSYLINQYLQIKGNVGRVYRLPTLNDRYWKPGGNPALLPESGWSQELGLSSTFQLGGLNYAISLTGFSRNIDNWMLWSKAKNNNFFIAQNIAKVWSRGLEPRISVGWITKKHTFDFSAQYDLIFSTNQKEIDLPKIEVGSQLWYTPRQQAAIIASWTWQYLELNYSHHFTDYTIGINENIDAYSIGNLRLSYTTDFSNPFQKTNKVSTQHIASLFIKINNLWNKRYFVIERRPMPGINGQIGIRIKLN